MLYFEFETVLKLYNLGAWMINFDHFHVVYESVSLPRCAMGLTVICVCGITWSYPPFYKF